MITPKEFAIEDFITNEDDPHFISALREEALTGSELVDNLILLEFCSLPRILEVLRDKYQMPFSWLNRDMTPPEYRAIADKHGVLIERGRAFVVYVPLGSSIDDALLQIDIPQYEITIRYIADCNYRLLQRGLTPGVLSLSIAPFRPLLVFRRIIADCITSASTDVHFWSCFENKQHVHKISYRINREKVPAPFSMDFELMKKVMQSVIGKLTASSAADLDSDDGVVTTIPDVFRDGSCDIRVVAYRTAAGYFMECAVQTTDTTNYTVDELGFPEADVSLIRQLAKKRTGLTLVTGEMRSGKNTTIFAMLNEIIDDPINIMEYSNPIENRMSFNQIDYRGDIEYLKKLLVKAKKSDIDIAVLNEIPDSSVAFAVRDLVNSAIGVITTTHIHRVWHAPIKLREFFGEDYKTVISQLNCVINHRMFRRWAGPGLQKRVLVKESGSFEMQAYQAGVRQYFVPTDASKMTYRLQPLVEIVVLTDSIKTSILNFEEVWKAEQMLNLQLTQQHATLENKVAAYINEGLMSIEELRRI